MSHTPKLHWYAATAKAGYEMYELWNDDALLLVLTFNPFSQTAKVECQHSCRNFKIEKEGFLRSKTILKNEYGIKIGELGIESWFKHEGFIDLNGERFFYTTQRKEVPELLIYKTSKKNPLVICDLTTNNGSTGYTLTDKNKDADKHTSLLMALCWYIATPLPANEIKIATYNK